MELKRLNHRLDLDFTQGIVDTNKYVSIYTRKQIRQKREGLRACQF